MIAFQPVSIHRLVVPLAIVAMTWGASPTPVLAEDALGGGYAADAGRSELAPYLQCVPYARRVSGVQIYGDAHTWWDQAEGSFARGNRPRPGAVMAFQPHRNMRLGHVAAVSRVIDARTVLLRHANWSPINGRRGQIEDDVRALDVSPNNDWSEVRVWYDPIQGLGKTAWPIHGFIYSDRAPSFAATNRIAQAGPPIVDMPRPISPEFRKAFVGLHPKPTAPANRQTATRTRTLHRAMSRPVIPPQTRRTDPMAAAVSLYD
ncbi:MAG: CHAP domain-containing protein [Pontixanthobacter sp.]